MNPWEKKLNKVIEQVLAADNGIVGSGGWQTTSDSDMSEGTQSSEDIAKRSNMQEEKRVYDEMCELLDRTLHLTVNTILNSSMSGYSDPEYENDLLPMVQDLADASLSIKAESEDDDENYNDEILGGGHTGEPLPPHSSASFPSSFVLSLPPPLVALELCAVKKRLDDTELENNLLKEEIVRLHRLLSDASCGGSASSCRYCCECPGRDEEEASDNCSALLAELIQTKCSLALALSNVEEERLQRYKILHAVDKLME